MPNFLSKKINANSTKVLHQYSWFKSFWKLTLVSSHRLHLCFDPSRVWFLLVLLVFRWGCQPLPIRFQNLHILDLQMYKLKILQVICSSNLDESFIIRKEKNDIICSVTRGWWVLRTGLYNTAPLCDQFQMVAIDYFSCEVPLVQMWSQCHL